jgi:hypothetical protein
MQQLITAMPELLNKRLTIHHEFVIKFRKYAENAIRHKKNSSKLKLLDEVRGVKLYSFEVNQESGIYFTSILPGEVHYMHVWSKVDVVGLSHSAEALAFRFGPRVAAIGMKEVFFDYLLPRFKVVFSDVEYTDDGKRWFEGQYSAAYQSSAYTILLADHELGTVVDLKSQKEKHSLTEFMFSLERYWGSSELYKRYRFAIKLK